ncbi:MAG: protein kinase [bacterium]
MMIGKTIDNYRITEKLGEGGMGVVYKATHIRLDKTVAIKMLHPIFSSDEALLQRLQQEAKILSQLEACQSIVHVSDVRETEYGWIIVMQYIDGITLAQKVKQVGAVPWQSALPIFVQLLSAIRYAHQAGVIHRDIKPGNVMLDKDGNMLLTDFGLAKSMSRATSTHSRGKAIGTPEFMPPEQFDALGKVDKRSDIYSLGMTFYKVLAGKTPFRETDSDFTIPGILHDKEKFTPVHHLKPDIPESLSRIIAKAIEKNPGQRFQSAEQMLHAIEQFEQERGFERTTQVVRTEPVAKKRKQAGPVLTISFLVFAVAAIAYLAVQTGMLQRSNQPKEPGESGEVVSPKNPDRVDLPGTNQDDRDKPSDQSKDSVRVTPPAASAAGKVDGGPEKPAKKEVVPPPVVVQEKAYLELAVVPNGSIFVDGKPVPGVSQSPTTVPVLVGPHTIRFQHPRYGSHTITVDLARNPEPSYTCYFESYFSISSDPIWGTIWVNGSSTAKTTPYARLPLAPGEYRINVVRKGYETVGGAKTVVVRPTLRETVVPLVFALRENAN